jgi:hypothetical protein
MSKLQEFTKHSERSTVQYRWMNYSHLASREILEGVHETGARSTVDFAGRAGCLIDGVQTFSCLLRKGGG